MAKLVDAQRSERCGLYALEGSNPFDRIPEMIQETCKGSSMGRASACRAEGRGFETRSLLAAWDQVVRVRSSVGERRSFKPSVAGSIPAEPSGVVEFVPGSFKGRTQVFEPCHRRSSRCPGVNKSLEVRLP